jgi:hypothetical protein
MGGACRKESPVADVAGDAGLIDASWVALFERPTLDLCLLVADVDDWMRDPRKRPDLGWDRLEDGSRDYVPAGHRLPSLSRSTHGIRPTDLGEVRRAIPTRMFDRGLEEFSCDTRDHPVVRGMHHVALRDDCSRDMYRIVVLEAMIPDELSSLFCD